MDVRALTKDGKRATRVAIEPGEMSFTVLTPNRDLTCRPVEPKPLLSRLGLCGAHS